MIPTPSGLTKTETPSQLQAEYFLDNRPVAIVVGPGRYNDNIQSINAYAGEHGRKFRLATTAEVIRIAAENMGDIGTRILDHGGLQLGMGLKMNKGILINPPRDSQGEYITDKDALNNLLSRGSWKNNFWLGENDMALASYEPYDRTMRNIRGFIHTNLARALEHTIGDQAKNLKVILEFDNPRNVVSISDFQREAETSKEIVPGMISIDHYDDGRISKKVCINHRTFEYGNNYTMGIPLEDNL